ncbi:MAG: adenylyltransferase/cytidyltransferase family protein, partial [Gemmatimonadetes bacterium]|nr:adenylyltransferase/cytidyltransferase family protein [Gemmatimonadota bacterium]
MRTPASKLLERHDAVRVAGPGRSFRLVFTNGCFDVLHRGHVECLTEARRLGDALLVAINTD